MIIGVVASIVGGIVSGVGAYRQGQAQKKMYQYQSDVASQQQKEAQKAADANVRLTQIQASEDAAQLQRKYMVLAGEQKATGAAMGIGSGSVSMGDIETDTLNTRTADENMIRYNADLKSWDIRNQAANEIWGLETLKTQYGFAGKQAAASGKLGLLTGIFAGTAAGAGQASNFQVTQQPARTGTTGGYSYSNQAGAKGVSMGASAGRGK